MTQQSHSQSTDNNEAHRSSLVRDGDKAKVSSGYLYRAGRG